ncbi:MAG: GNAT family N-acetyltransferase [Fusicatenibacter sp.]|nr:GNAT family N-acetyltransferase [Lachnospiraceae bacterium]MDY2938345.1 GNAT family N-acetyltransferase [Fusicatenibacter sp.]
MNLCIRKAKPSDLDQIEKLYADLCDYLSEGVNYPGWKKDIYPTAVDALKGIEEQTLYVAADGDVIVGSVILRHWPEKNYEQAQWITANDYSKIYVIYTLAVHPKYLRMGVAENLLAFSEEKAKEEECISIRLDVVKGNIPAENLYKKSGFRYVDTISLGYEEFGLPWFCLYEKPLHPE